MASSATPLHDSLIELAILDAHAHAIKWYLNDVFLSNNVSIYSFVKYIKLKGGFHVKIKNYDFEPVWPIKGADSRKNTRKIYKKILRLYNAHRFACSYALLKCVSAVGGAFT